jgi:hypothetical protein
VTYLYDRIINLPSVGGFDYRYNIDRRQLNKCERPDSARQNLDNQRRPHDPGEANGLGSCSQSDCDDQATRQLAEGLSGAPDAGAANQGFEIMDEDLFTAARRLLRDVTADNSEGGWISIKTQQSADILRREVEREDARRKREAEELEARWKPEENPS